MTTQEQAPDLVAGDWVSGMIRHDLDGAVWLDVAFDPVPTTWYRYETFTHASVTPVMDPTGTIVFAWGEAEVVEPPEPLQPADREAIAGLGQHVLGAT